MSVMGRAAAFALCANAGGRVAADLFAMLSERGFAPTYYGRFTNGRIEGWMDARPLEPEEMGQTQPVDFLGMIGRELGVMHTMDIPGSQSPVLWEVRAIVLGLWLRLCISRCF